MQDRRTRERAQEHDLDGLVRHVALADWLVLAVVLLYQIVAPVRAATLPLAAALVSFAAISIAVRMPRLAAARPALALELEAWAMTAFISVVAWFTGGVDSPLESLYLLPIVLAALVMPAARLVLLLLAIAAAFVAVMTLKPGGAIAGPVIAGRLFAVVGPLAVVAWLTAQLGTAVMAARRRAAALSDGDALTGLVTRRVFLERLKSELANGERRGQTVGVLVVDLEGSRRLNEQYGHDAGNAALKLVAEALRRTLRETDIAARWGGDEFAVLLPGADAASVQVAAQRIRHNVHATTLEAGPRLLRCSVSIGGAATPRDGREAAALIAQAERRLERDRDLRRSAAAVAAQPG